MVVSVGDQTMIIPIAQVVENLRPNDSALRSVGPGRRLLNVRGQQLPIIRLGERFKVGDCPSDPTGGVFIVVETDAGLVALQADRIEDQRQVVVKSLDTNYRGIPGIAGATIMGDGTVALILDIPTLGGGAGQRLAA